MFKNIYLVYILSLISFPLLGMSSSDTYIANLTTQLGHVNNQIKAVKRAWNESRFIIAKIEKALPDRSASIKQAFDKIIAGNTFITTMNAAVNQQFESIVNNNMPFTRVTYNLSDFYSGPMHTLGQRLYTAMATKAHYFLLGKKLAQKSKELAVTIIGLKRQMTANQ